MSHHPVADFKFHELEALAIFVEEAGEALQAAGKLLRHGKIASDGLPPNAMTYYNLAALQKEVIDLLMAVLLLQHTGLVDLESPMAELQASVKIKALADRFHYIGGQQWIDAARAALEI